MVKRITAFLMSMFLSLTVSMPSFASVASSSNAQRFQAPALMALDTGVTAVASDLQRFDNGYIGYDGVQVNIYTESAGWYSPTTLSKDDGQSYYIAPLPSDCTGLSINNNGTVPVELCMADNVYGHADRNPFNYLTSCTVYINNPFMGADMPVDSFLYDGVNGKYASLTLQPNSSVGFTFAPQEWAQINFDFGYASSSVMGGVFNRDNLEFEIEQAFIVDRLTYFRSYVPAKNSDGVYSYRLPSGGDIKEGYTYEFQMYTTPGISSQLWVHDGISISQVLCEGVDVGGVSTFEFTAPFNFDTGSMYFNLYPASDQITGIVYKSSSSDFIPVLTPEQAQQSMAANTTVIKNVVTNIENVVNNITNQITNMTSAITGAISDGISQMTQNDNQNTDKIVQSDKENTDKIIASDEKIADDIKNGYDSSSLTSENEKLSDTLTEFESVENELFDQASENLSNFQFEDPFDKFSGPLSDISYFLNGIYYGLGAFNIPIGFSLTLAIALLCIGWYRFRGG